MSDTVNKETQGIQQATDVSTNTQVTEPDFQKIYTELNNQRAQYHTPFIQEVRENYKTERSNYGVDLFEMAERNDDGGLWARTVIDTVSASMKATDEEYNLQKQKEDMFRYLGERFDPTTITDKDLQYRISDMYIRKFAKMTDEYGAPTEDMLNNPQFVDNVSPTTYAYLGTMYNTIHQKSIGGEIMRNINYTDASRANSLDLAHGDIDYDEYLDRQQKIDSRFKLASDRSYVGGVAGVVEGMVKPVVDNPTLSLATGAVALAGSLTGITELSAIGTGLFMFGTQGLNAGQLTQADILSSVYEQDPNADREEVLRGTAWAWWGVTALNTVDPITSVKLSGIGKVANGVLTYGKDKLLSRVVNNRAIDTLEEVTKKDIKKRVIEVARKTAGAYLLDSSLEVAQEMGEGALTSLGVDRYLHKSWSTALSNAYNSAIKSGKEAFVPSFIVTGFMHTPRTFASMVSLRRSYNELEQNVRGRSADEIASQSDVAQRDPETNESVVNSTLQNSMVYIDGARAKVELEKAGYSAKDYGADFQKTLDTDHKGERIAILEGKFVNFKPEIRDILAPLTSNKDGRPIPESVRRVLSSKKIDELNKEFRNNQQIIAQREQSRIKIKSQLNTDLSNNSHIKKSQRSFIANVGSSFMSAMSEITGVDINTLYNQFKPTYKMVDELDLTDHKKHINRKDITGTFDNGTNIIQLKPNSDFNTVFHETAHWFLNVMRDLSNENVQKTLGIQNTRIHLGMKELAEWSGFTKPLEQMTDAEFNMFSEKFVAGFTLSLLNTRTGKENSIFSGFKRFLYSLKNQSIFSNLKENEDKAQHLKQGFEFTYGEPLPEINDAFMNVINAMFSADVLTEMQELDYPRNNILDLIDDPSVPDTFGVKKYLKEELTKALESINGNIESATQILTIKQALVMTLDNKDMNQVIKKILENIPEKMKNKREIKAYLDRILKETEVFKAEKERQLKELATDPKYKYINEIKDNIKINPLGLDENTVKALKAKGFISEDSGLSLSDIAHASLPKVIQNYVNHSKYSPEVALANFFIKTPSMEQRASQIAMSKSIRNFGYDMAKSVSNLEKASAKAHKSLADATLKALHNALGDKYNARQTKAEIETVAEIDSNEMVYKNTKPRTLLGNASQENYKTKNCIANGDINGAVRHTRNEYYLNHKADYVSKMKLYVDKKLSDFKSFCARTDKNLSKNYDVDFVNLVRHIAYQIGITENRPQTNLQTLTDKLIERYPDQKDDIKAIVSLIEEQGGTLSTEFKDQTFTQLTNTIDLLDALKGKASELRNAYVGNEKARIEDVANSLVDQLKTHKTKRGGLETENGTASTREVTWKDKIGGLWREFSHSFTLVENLCQQIDKATNGVFHKWIYQVGKDAEVDYKIDKEKYTKRIGDALRRIKKITAKPITAHELIRADSGKAWDIGQGKFKGQTTLELMGMILHMGTNLEKFLDGYLADDPRIDKNNRKAQLQYKQDCFEKFFKRMVKEGHITKEMLDACQEIWSVNEEIADKVDNASRKVRGYPFKRLPVRTIDVEFPDGTIKPYSAGYMPAISNSDLNLPHVDNSESIYETLNNLGNEMPLTNPSFLQDRTAKAYPLELDPTILVGRINDTLRYAHMMPAVVQIKKTLDNPKVRQMLEDKYPDAYDQVFMNWLKSLSTMQSSVPSGRLAKILNFIVRGSAMQIMVGNINNALQQFSNIPTLLLRTSPSELIRCLPVMFNKEMKAQILAESKFMAVRIKEMNDGINEIFSEIILDGSAFESTAKNAKAKFKKIQYFTNKNAYIAQKVTQNVIDYVGYMSAKNTALKKGMSETEAIQYAEATVRNCLGSFDLADVASIQRNSSILKAFTMFGGYFYSMWRLMETEVKNSFANYGITDYHRYIGATLGVFYAIVAPSLIAELVNSVVGNGSWGDDDDDTDILKSNYFWAPFKMASASFPVVGKLISADIDALQGKYFYSSAMLQTPFLTQASTAWNSVFKLANGEEIKGRDIKAMIACVGILSNVSALGFIARPLGAGYDIYQENAIPDTLYEYIRELLIGNSAKRVRMN